MAGRRLIGARIPLVQRIRRYGSMATLFRSYDDSAESRLPSPELVVPRSIGDLNDVSFEDASVVKATLLPGESSLPVGLMVPPVGLAPTTQRDPINAPPVQREVRVPRTRPFQAPEAPSIPQAPQAEQAALERAKTPEQQPTSDSSISDADWTRLKAVMQGHQEKLAREKDSPEYIQRAKEEAEQEAARKKAETETERRQELARSGKLPKARVVYLSPDQPAPIPVMPTDTPEIHPSEQERVEGVVEEPAIDEILDTGIEAVEEVQKEDIAEKPDTIEAAEPHRPDPQAAPEAVQLTPDDQAPGKRISEPEVESFTPRDETTAPGQQTEPLETEPVVEPVAKTLQMAEEPAESPSLPEAETPSTPEAAAESEQKTGIGHRLLEAARSVFRRSEEPASSPETSVVQAEPSATQAEPSATLTEPSAPLTEPSAPLTEPTIPQAEPSAPLTEPSAPQVEPSAPQVEPSAPQVEPSAPQVEPSATVDEPSTVQAEPPAPQAEPSLLMDEEEEVSSEILEEKPVDILATDELDAGQDSQEAVYQPKQQIEEEFQVQDVPDSPTIDTPVAQSARPEVQRKPERTAPETPESPTDDEIPSRQPPGKVAEESRLEDETLIEPVVKAVDETIAETPVKIQKEEPTKSEFEPESPLAEREAPAPMERREPLPETSRDKVWVQEEPQAGTPETAEIQLEPEASGPEPAATELDVETRADVKDGFESTTEDAAKQVELFPEPGKEERIDKPQPPLPLDSEERITDLQQLPLEEAWPVQEVAPSPFSEIFKELAPEPSAPEPAADDSDLPTLIVQREPLDDDSSVAELRAAIDKVLPGKPTDSSVELVPPRRPRPEAPPIEPRVEEIDIPESHSQPIQRLADEPVTSEPSAIMDRSDDGIPEARYRTPTERQEPAPSTIPTEIGELPSDLWGFLGETPPVSTASHPFLDAPTTGLAIDTVQREDAVTETPTPVLESAPPLQPFGLETAVPWIQRQPETEQAATEPAEDEEEREETEEHGTGETDIEALARQILPIIKRRLSIEWERNRGRF